MNLNVKFTDAGFVFTFILMCFLMTLIGEHMFVTEITPCSIHNGEKFINNYIRVCGAAVVKPLGRYSEIVFFENETSCLRATVFEDLNFNRYTSCICVEGELVNNHELIVRKLLSCEDNLSH